MLMMVTLVIQEFLPITTGQAIQLLPLLAEGEDINVKVSRHLADDTKAIVDVCNDGNYA